MLNFSCLLVIYVVGTYGWSANMVQLIFILFLSSHECLVKAEIDMLLIVWFSHNCYLLITIGVGLHNVF